MSNQSGATYASAGVNIDKGNQFAQMIKTLVRANWPEAADQIGGFAGGMPIPPGARKVSGSVDGVGTVAILAALANMLTGIGHNGVAMSAVDMYVSGARPAFLLDTLRVGQLDPEKHIQIIESIIEACLTSGCIPIGGETAELPDVFRYPWMFDLDVSVIGFPDPELEYVPMEEGMHVYGWPSHGPGSNGFSLLRKVHRLRIQEDGFLGMIRKVFNLHGSKARVINNLMKPLSELGGNSLAEALLVPTPIWIPEMEEARKRGVRFAGHAHITGGGMVENIPRILPNDLKVTIWKYKIKRPPIFHYTQQMGNIEEAEMDRVFNQGVMVVSVVDPIGPEPYYPAFKIGEVRQREKKLGELEEQVDFRGQYC
ncbi:MAG: Phosphoribosylformylglycinamidine cyclo-ligase [Candidatus Moranbacteria bacterium GW2011_GWC1_45_18]|nr:MAG: Phosphoribosylformylglycinamidine cyclo-ligase [Candidatus Moranbacteria bacterium GW2011_GWC2_40_12]KKT33779.1 MAG: Phosphoribosylformylglycinamidine cyclo-ligase [Candidatus Moranbacteria bacterium GW2011_GWF2_44_10]KKT70018.1 MAG: Phosphoribosylformylglycinamidine cyclo-ligase [Candidatus Moranbacteria bacterium GW2011_GWF1_44_4]KKU00879.1 MAG: Phosphoribosylformylglycinamidine cyclo-ligase [Candidatus Moranbacteria bacterium GW2011_GWC1_45_18]OGI34564.1 MAG: hypothetical protein A24